MRSNNNNKLKAYVRFDGTGRIVPGSLVVQSIKPKDGNWKQIDAKECCNPTTTTTTTVTPTTTTTTTVTANQFTLGYWLSEEDSCNTTTAGNAIFYSPSVSLTAGSVLYSDAGLTTFATQGEAVVVGMIRYLIGANGVLSTITCP